MLRGSITQIKIHSVSAALLGVPGESFALCPLTWEAIRQCHSPLGTKLPLLAREELADQNGLTFQGGAVGQERKCQNTTSMACLQGGAGGHMLLSPRKDITSPQWKGVYAGEVSYLSTGEASTVEPMWASESSHLEHVCPLNSVYFLFTSD